MTKINSLAALFLVTVFAAQGSSAQTPAADPSAALKQVLPPQVAQRVLDKIAEARARQLPAEALENRALKFAAKGVHPAAIERSVAEQLERMDKARVALESGRGSRATGEEIEAGAEAIRKGVDGAAVSHFAKNAPRQRPLGVALMVIGNLREGGLSTNAALGEVLTKLNARASDAELERMTDRLPAQAAGRPTSRPGQTPPVSTPAGVGRPAGVPVNGAAGSIRPPVPAPGVRGY